MQQTDDQTIEYRGECAFALSTGKSGVAGSPRHRLIEQGRTFQFSNPVARLLWRILPDRKGKADATWKAAS